MSEPNLTRVCKLPSDLGAAAGRELYLDPDRLVFFVAGPGTPGANGAAEPLVSFLGTHPDLRGPIVTFLVGRMTGNPKAYEGESREELDRMVAGITDQNRHEEVDWGRPVGREAW